LAICFQSMSLLAQLLGAADEHSEVPPPISRSFFEAAIASEAPHIRRSKVAMEYLSILCFLLIGNLIYNN
jgi:hypothetical protein